MTSKAFARTSNNEHINEHHWSFPATSGNQAGFTLVELLVVVAVLGVLATLGIPSYYKYVKVAKIGSAVAEIRLIEKGIIAYQLEKGTLPPSLEAAGFGETFDPWGNRYQYSLTPTYIDSGGFPLNDDYDLYSLGGDKSSSRTITPLETDSSDDIVRSGINAFVGLSSTYETP